MLNVELNRAALVSIAVKSELLPLSINCNRDISNA
jgi:hypothetical protein